MGESTPHSHNGEPANRAFDRAEQEGLRVLLAIVERPELTPNIRLMGEMQGTGSKERQRLVQRGDRIVQVTKLLYRIAEQADGNTTL